NDFHPYFAQAPWRGYKQSGIGRELGKEGLEEYLVSKHILTNTNPQLVNLYSNKYKNGRLCSMSNMNQTIMDAFHFRHVTKQFDPQKKVSKEDFETILESGRLSPSSLGFKPWRFVVIQAQPLRDELKAHNFGTAKQ
ncbi:aldehyde dehydrogenase family protein, partial [Staphylococcus aureus]|uniref:aldehyde dehydrogenase family protein n=1 Tax=Staphylococcus aureus TaxID=1280 RepID=UPI00210B2F3B